MQPDLTSSLTRLPAGIDDLPRLRDILARHHVERVSFGDGELLTPENRMARMDNGAVLVFRHEDLRKLAPDPRLINVPADVYVQMYFEGTFCNARNGAMIELMGSEGTMYIDRGRFELIPEARGNQRAEEQIMSEGPRGRDFYPRPDGELVHLTNWIESIRNNRQPSAPISAGVSAAAAAHLGNQAYRQNRVAVAAG